MGCVLGGGGGREMMGGEAGLYLKRGKGRKRRAERRRGEEREVRTVDRSPTRWICLVGLLVIQLVSQVMGVREKGGAKSERKGWDGKRKKEEKEEKAGVREGKKKGRERHSRHVLQVVFLHIFFAAKLGV